MTVGFIGLGRMGGPMCRNLARLSGQEVVGFDPSEGARRTCAEAGVGLADSVAELASASDVIFTSLPMPDDVEAVASRGGGIGEHARSGTAWFDLSTNSVAVARRVAATLRSVDIEFLDTPVSGGPSGAEAGTLTLMIGGDGKVLEAHRPLLDCIATDVIHVGGVGAGLTAKLVNNLILLAGVAAACEGLTLAAAAGLPLDKLDAVIRSSSGDSNAYRAVADRARSGDDSASFTVDLAYKDVHLALEVADELSVPTPIGADVHNLMRMARGMGLGAADPTALIRVYDTILHRPIWEPAAVTS